MASLPLFRFIQASGLELDRFCSAAGEHTPEQARQLVDAPFRAAERVFETALREQAQLILLAGGAFVGRQPSTWGASFLARQIERVSRHGVQVCWVDAHDELQRSWPRYLPRPKNLHLCDANTTTPIRIATTNGVPIEIYCADDVETAQRRVAAATSAAAPPFRIAALTRPPISPARLDRPFEYWAICDGEAPATYPTMHGMARCAGTTQPRHNGTVSVGGCLLVDVGPGYSLGSQFVETGSLRYHVERVETDDSTNWEGFRRRLHARTEEILQSTIADAVIFQWQVQGHGPVLDRMIRPGDAAELAQELRSAFGTRTPAAWLTEFLPAPDAVQETRWQRDGSSFGAFVRTLDGIATGDQTHVDLAQLMADRLRTIDPAARHVPRPHYQTSLKSNARRQAAQLLTRQSR